MFFCYHKHPKTKSYCSSSNWVTLSNQKLISLYPLYLYLPSLSQIVSHTQYHQSMHYYITSSLVATQVMCAYNLNLLCSWEWMLEHWNMWMLVWPCSKRFVEIRISSELTILCNYWNWCWSSLISKNLYLCLENL
jgi:hypothetical protein